MRLEQMLQAKLKVLLLAGAALAALNAVVYFTAVSRLDRFAKDARARVEANRVKLQDLEAKRTKVADSVERVKQDRKVIEDLTGKVLRTRAERLVEMQEALHKLASDNQIALDNVGYSYSVLPSEEKAVWGRQFLRVSVNLPLTGTYQQVKSFLSQLQESPEFFVVESIALNADSQGSPTLHLNIALSTYFVADAKDLASSGKGGGA